jgi:hypothetical protein
LAISAMAHRCVRRVGLGCVAYRTAEAAAFDLHFDPLVLSPFRHRPNECCPSPTMTKNRVIVSPRQPDPCAVVSSKPGSTPSSHRRTSGFWRNPGATTTQPTHGFSNFGSYGTVDSCLDAGQEGKCASGSPRIDNRLVHLNRQHFDAPGERLHCFRELSILPEHFYEEGSLIRGKRRSLRACAVQSLAMFCIGEGMSRVAVGLAGLRQQNAFSSMSSDLQRSTSIHSSSSTSPSACKRHMRLHSVL